MREEIKLYLTKNNIWVIGKLDEDVLKDTLVVLFKAESNELTFKFVFFGPPLNTSLIDINFTKNDYYFSWDHLEIIEAYKKLLGEVDSKIITPSNKIIC